MWWNLKKENAYLRKQVRALREELKVADARLDENRKLARELYDECLKERERVARVQNDYAGWFVELAHQIFNWSNHNWPRRKSKDVVCSMTEEIGELMRAETKAEQGIRGTLDYWEAEAKREWGDVLIAALDYALVRGWSPVSVLQDRWNEVSVRDWQKFPKNGKTE